MTGVQKILPIGAPNGSKRSGSGKAKSKATTPETNKRTGDGATEEDAGKLVEEISGVEGPTPSRKSGLERFMFDKSKSHDEETS